MKNHFSPYMITGIGILVIYIIVERFIQPVDPMIAIPVLLFAIVLIIIDGVKRRISKNNNDRK